MGDHATARGVEEEPAGTNLAARFPREELLSIARASRGQISDIQATFTASVHEPKEQLVNRQLVTVVLKRDRIYIDHFYSADPDTQYEFRRVLAYDGTRATTYEAWRGVAAVRDGCGHPEWTSAGWEFFGLNLLHELRLQLLCGMEHETEGTGLLSLLADQETTVRPFLEVFQGVECHVVERPFLKQSAGPNDAVWLDAQRGCVPVRQVYHRYCGDPPYVDRVWTATEVAEVHPGLWLAVRGRCRYPLRDGRPESSDHASGRGCGFPVEPSGYTKGLSCRFPSELQPAVKVNAGVDDELFHLWRRLPPGTDVRNYAEGRWYLAAAGGAYGLGVPLQAE